MKKRFSLLLIITLFGCDEISDQMLISNLEGTVPLNPEVAQIIEDRIWDAVITNKGDILLMTGANRLYWTSDGFRMDQRSISVSKYYSLETATISFFGSQLNVSTHNPLSASKELFSDDEVNITEYIGPEVCACWNDNTSLPKGYVRSSFMKTPNSGWRYKNLGDFYSVLEKYEDGTFTTVETFNAVTGRVFFVNEKVGYVLAEKVIKTVNGGESWRWVYGSEVPLDRLFIWDEASFASSTYDLSHIIVTSDAGVTWQKYNRPDQTKGVAVTKRGWLLRSINSSVEYYFQDFQTGEKHQVFTPSGVYGELTSSTNGKYLLYYDDSFLYFSDDDGLNWTELIYPYGYLLEE